MMNITKFERKKREEFEKELGQLLTWYKAGISDCKAGVYDKYYRYHSNSANEAYDAGWVYQNGITKNESVKFIEVAI